MKKLFTALVITFLLPLPAFAHGVHPVPSQLQLIEDAYKKAQRLTRDMEYKSMFESSCSSMMGSTPHKDWLLENTSRLAVLSKIQKMRKDKAIASGGQKMLSYFANEDAQLKQEVDLAKNMIVTASAEKKSRLCKALYADADPSSENSKSIESDLSFLVEHEEDILKALNNADNW